MTTSEHDSIYQSGSEFAGTRGGRLVISFENQALERLCLEERAAIRQLGIEGTRKLRIRVAELDAAPSGGDLVTGYPHPLTGDRCHQLAVRLDEGRRLVFEPAEAPWPRLADGSVDWSRVTSVRVVDIGDDHD